MPFNSEEELNENDFSSKFVDFSSDTDSDSHYDYDYDESADEGNQIEKAIALKKFQIESCPKYCNTLIIGKSFSGKSVLLKDIYNKIGKLYDQVFVITSQYFLDEYCQYTNSANIITKDEDIAPLLSYMASNDNELSKLLIVEKPGATKCKQLFQDLIINSRHNHISIIILDQHLPSMPIHVRANFDYVFGAHENYKSLQMRFHSYFVGIPFKKYTAISDKLTKDYGWIVIDNKTRKNVFAEDSIYWYRADPTEWITEPPKPAFDIPDMYVNINLPQPEIGSYLNKLNIVIKTCQDLKEQLIQDYQKYDK